MGIPPWRWSIWGPWPPEVNSHLIPAEQIRPLAERLSKQRPWLSAEENWLAAERALHQQPWRPCLILFSGDKERSGWDWADLLLKISVPILILGLSTAYSFISSGREEKLTQNQKESDVVTDYIKEMKPLLLDRGLTQAPKEAKVIGVAKALTLASLTRLKSDEAPKRRTIIMRFLLDSGMRNTGGFFNMPGVNLSGADLSGADLTGSQLNLGGANLNNAKLDWAKLDNAMLTGANLRGASLIDVNLNSATLNKADLGGAKIFGARLNGAKLREADLSGADTTLGSAIGCNLSNADLYRANLRGANFSGATLEGASLRRSDLRGTNLSTVFLKQTDFAGINWDKRTKWPNASRLKGAVNMPEALKKELGL
jgi:uncharacterized protein YjbI with pentapeptide repeats